MGREVFSLLMGWALTLGFFGAVLYAIYRINGVYRQMEELRDDLKVVREHLEGAPRLQ